MSEFDREKWDSKYNTLESAPVEPSLSLLRLEPFLPKSGRALDLAGGAGRHSIWMAKRGLDVTLADVSQVGLAIARQRACGADVSIRLHNIDLELDGVPAGPWDLLLSHYYFCRNISRKWSLRWRSKEP
jgi:2-polyprenyl-3-methyl-5-hydroxy-6-metoxy-1,4-benzoquinol methylase